MADQNFMDLASKTASGIAGTDYMMLVNNSEAYKALVNDVAEAILGKLTSKSFSGLETTAKNVIGALNELNSKTTKTYAKQTSASYPVLKIIPSFISGNMISFVNRNGRVDIYIYNSNNAIGISTKYVYGQNYEVVSDGSAIYIKVDADTTNFVSSLYDCSVGTVQSLDMSFIQERRL